jgi:hypothetical protein
LKLFNRELAGKALSGLLIFGALAICFPGFATKQTVFESPCVLPNAGAFYFGIWRPCRVSQLVENALRINGAV